MLAQSQSAAPRREIPAASLAAYAARAGLTAKVYLPAGQVSQNKLAQALDFGAEIVQVEGSFDLALERMLHTPTAAISTS